MTLEQADKIRLAKIIDFAEAELNDLKDKFRSADFKKYTSDREFARNIERCLENIVNASLDIAKIVLVNEKLPIPDTYREYFLSLYTGNLVNEKTANILADGVRLRNVLAHQYLDTRWDRIKKILTKDWQTYEQFFGFIKKDILSI
jgi:uncharacterized protein YutE (UPF0331/DUF86 family)